MFTFGNKIRLQLFGQSHSPSMGAVLDGFPSGIAIDQEKLAAFMERRAPGRDEFSTKRREADRVEFVSGVANRSDGTGDTANENAVMLTTGAPICMVIHNEDTRSGDYDRLRFIPRPSHADYPAFARFGEARDHRGGGEFSGRLTAPLCAAGFLCLEVLRQKGVEIGAHISSVGPCEDDRFDPLAPQLHIPKEKPFPVLNDEQGANMQEIIRAARASADSIGGSIECAITGVPAGAGGTSFGSLEGLLSLAMFAIPAVKGVEFGSGFAGTQMRGSENNDPYRVDGDRIVTSSNHAGGILGGLATGMPILFRVAVKPTASIGREQDSVSLPEKRNVSLQIVGRHDPCIVQRAVPVVEAAAAVAMLDILL
ncbi:MAG: chorismate synthase [Oscillospiraceae bacterium]|nr:chorismate synthase [Oscillospiraceae bacterium]